MLTIVIVLWIVCGVAGCNLMHNMCIAHADDPGLEQYQPRHVWFVFLGVATLIAAVLIAVVYGLKRKVMIFMDSKSVIRRVATQKEEKNRVIAPCGTEIRVGQVWEWIPRFPYQNRMFVSVDGMEFDGDATVLFSFDDGTKGMDLLSDFKEKPGGYRLVKDVE